MTDPPSLVEGDVVVAAAVVLVVRLVCGRASDVGLFCAIYPSGGCVVTLAFGLTLVPIMIA